MFPPWQVRRASAAELSQPGSSRTESATRDIRRLRAAVLPYAAPLGYQHAVGAGEGARERRDHDPPHDRREDGEPADLRAPHEPPARLGRARRHEAHEPIRDGTV